MASSSSPNQDFGPDHIIRPRPVKPSNPMVLRAQSEEGSLKPNGHIDTIMSGTSRYAGFEVLIEEILLNSQQWPFHPSTRGCSSISPVHFVGPETGQSTAKAQDVSYCRIRCESIAF